MGSSWMYVFPILVLLLATGLISAQPSGQGPNINTPNVGNNVGPSDGTLGNQTDGSKTNQTGPFGGPETNQTGLFNGTLGKQTAPFDRIARNQTGINDDIFDTTTGAGDDTTTENLGEPDDGASGYQNGPPSLALPPQANGGCGGSYIGDTDRRFISSPNYPDQYPTSVSCEWNITGGDTVVLEIHDMEIEGSNGMCYDYLVIADGTETLRLCGSDKRSRVNVTTPLTLFFESDMSIEKRGFLLEYYISDGKQIDECEYTLRGSVGQLTSPGFPGEYPPSITCTWRIEVPEDHQVVLTIVNFQVESDPYCRLDKVTLYLGEDQISNSTELCGSRQNLQFTSTLNNMTIVFTSDDRGQHSGFEMRFTSSTSLDTTQRPGKGNNGGLGSGSGASGASGGSGASGASGTSVNICGDVELNDNIGDFSSPGFPEYYNAGLNCSWTVEVDTGNRIEITLTTFDLPGTLAQPSSCTSAGLIVYDSGQYTGTYCGRIESHASSRFLSISNMMTFIFYTTENSQGHEGFLIQYFAVREGGPAAAPGGGTGVPGGGSEAAPGYGTGPGGRGSMGTFTCDNGFKIAKTDTCNGYSECGDNSDESATRANCTGTFFCSDGSPVLEYQKCDGFQHCADGSDESSVAGCKDFFSCTDGLIIPYNFQCDGFDDCSDGSDEGVVNNCPGDPCEAAECEHGSHCISQGLTSYSCLCTAGWSGTRCQTDIDDSCVGKPCQNGGTCFDQVNGLRCACAPGYIGDRCETAVGVSKSYNLRVSMSYGTDNGSCGTADIPCQSLGYAIARAPAGSIIILLNPGDESLITMNNTWISRSFNLAAPVGGSLHVHLEDVVLAGSSEDKPTLTFKEVVLTGELYIGNATVVLRNCNAKNMTFQQDYQRRMPNGEIELSFVSSTLENSKVLTQNLELQERNSDVKYNLYSATLTMTVCSLVNTEINIKASNATVRMTGTSVASTSPGGGVFISTGVRAAGGTSPPTPPPIPPARKRRDLSSKITDNDPGGYSISEGQNEGNHVKHRTKRQAKSTSPPAPRQPSTLIRMVECSFTNVNKYTSISPALHVTVKSGDALVEAIDTTFRQHARGIHLAMKGGAEGTLRVITSTFTDNNAEGPGAGIYLEQETGTLSTRIESSDFVNNVARALKSNDTGRVDINKLSKITGSGGAIAIIVQSSEMSGIPGRSFADIRRCRFTGNTAENYGGSLYFNGNVAANVDQCNFTNVEGDGLRPRFGDIIEGRGNLVLNKVRFDIASALSSVSILSYRADEDGSFMTSADLHIICPEGYQTKEIYNSITVGINNATRTPIETLLLYCEACTQGSYTLDKSGALVNGIKVVHTTINTCNKCPYGAVCEEKVKAKSNFWGTPQPNGLLEMHSCPSGYCCPSAICEDFNICSDNREGPLCGKCRSGYSESLFSTTCLPNEDCSYFSIIWLLVALYGIGYVLFFLFEDELMLIVGNFAGWLVKNIRKISFFRSNKNRMNRISARSFTEDGAQTSDSFLSIFMYYIQISELLKVDLLYSTDRENPISSVQKTILSVFSFQAIGINQDICLFKDITPVTKSAIMIANIVYLFAVWIVLFIIGYMLRCFIFCSGNKPKWITAVTIKAKFLGTFVNLLLYTYQYFAENTFSLLKCVNVGSDSSSVLYIDGSITCYESWQYGVIAVAAGYIFPFFMVLLFGPILLKRGQIRVSTFILSAIFPIFGTPCLLSVWLRSSRDEVPAIDYDRNDDSDRNQKELRIGSRVTITDILMSPFREDFTGGLCWEGVIALRRLCIVMAATLIPTILYKQAAVTVMCFLSLGAHVHALPYATPFSNTVESLSLGALLFISVGNLLKAVFVDSGTVPQETADELLFVYDWIEVTLLSLIPMILICCVAFAVIARMVAFMIKRCKICCGFPVKQKVIEGFDELPDQHRRSRRKPRKKLSSIQKKWVHGYAGTLENYGIERMPSGRPEFNRNWEELSNDASLDRSLPGSPPAQRNHNYIQQQPAHQMQGNDSGWKAPSSLVLQRSSQQKRGQFYEPFPKGTLKGMGSQGTLGRSPGDGDELTQFSERL